MVVSYIWDQDADAEEQADCVCDYLLEHIFDMAVGESKKVKDFHIKFESESRVVVQFESFSEEYIFEVSRQSDGATWQDCGIDEDAVDETVLNHMYDTVFEGDGEYFGRQASFRFE